MLVDALGGDECAPMYVIRIWAHCQQRRGDAFSMPAAGLRGLCRAPGDADVLEAALVAAGFVERDGALIRVPKWSEKNASLIAAWENGNKGGRPKKEPKQNPRVQDVEPTDNPRRTQAEPIRLREEQRQEQIQDPPASRVPPAVAGPQKTAKGSKRCPEGFDLSADLLDFARTSAPRADVHAELAKFRDHTFKSSRSDWPATFRNWLREADSRADRPASRPSFLAAKAEENAKWVRGTSLDRSMQFQEADHAPSLALR